VVGTCTRPQRNRRTPCQADEVIHHAPRHPVVEGVEARQLEAAVLTAHQECPPIPSLEDPQPMDDTDPSVNNSLGPLPNLRCRTEGDRSFLHHIQDGYPNDPLCAKVLDNIEHHSRFTIVDGLIYTRNWADETILCIPNIVADKCRLTEIVISQAHEILSHFGLQKTAEYVRRHYWWPRIRQDVKHYCKMCPICQTTKSSTVTPQRAYQWLL
jgi:hypothetical protein